MTLAARISLIGAAVLSLAVAALTLRALPLGLVQAFPDMGAHVELRRAAFLAHIIASPLALALGALQFFPRIRARWPVWHRWAGRGYGLAIGIGGAGGFVAALGATGGLVAGVGFALLAILWIGVTGRAVWLAMQRRLAEHRAWMVRSFALTFAAVTLRLYLPLFLAAGYSYPEASVWLAWLCWLPNLALAELWLARRTLAQRALVRRLVWPILAATGAVYGAIMLWSLPQLSALSGGLAMFDVRPVGYDLDEARAILTALGDPGREFYLHVQHGLDTAFPPLAAASFAIWYRALYTARRGLVLALSAMALAGAGFDLAENAAVADLLRAGPEALSAAQVGWAARMTQAKSALNTLSFVALVPGLVMLGRRLVRRRLSA